MSHSSNALSHEDIFCLGTNSLSWAFSEARYLNIHNTTEEIIIFPNYFPQSTWKFPSYFPGREEITHLDWSHVFFIFEKMNFLKSNTDNRLEILRAQNFYLRGTSQTRIHSVFTWGEYPPLRQLEKSRQEDEISLEAQKPVRSWLSSPGQGPRLAFIHSPNYK